MIQATIQPLADGDLPERVIDVLAAPFNLHRDSPDHRQRLYAFAAALREEVLARVPGPTMQGFPVELDEAQDEMDALFQSLAGMVG